jgi:class 3 adenylate cyclase
MWEWELESPPAALWPLVSDTNRFNLEAGAPSIEALGVEADGRRRLRVRALGRGIEYDETPFEWVRPERFGVVRRFRSGPIAELAARLALAPRNGGSLLTYEVRAVPRGFLGRPLTAIGMRRVHRRFDEVFRRFDRAAAGGRALPAPRVRPLLAPGGPERLAVLGKELVAGGLASDLVARLGDTIETADDVTAARLRPHALADAWGAGRRAVLELALQATRAGLLESRWELLCPLCRGATRTARSLGELESHAHCDSCDVDVVADLDRSLELVFRPHPAVRDVPLADFCVAGPGLTPHIVAQQRLAPGERRTLRLPLEAGGYRARVRGVDGSRPFTVAPEEPFAIVELSNATDREALHVVERTAWTDQAATAGEVTALQAFRDLFGREALRPGEELSVGSLAIAFTDLRDSTRLYQDIGDASAYGSVVAHFDVLREAVRREDGAVVKTIGDAVMAVFRRPVCALRALGSAQRELASAGLGRRPLLLKAGVHLGPCLAVTSNDRLDYFGSTVNLAARIVGLSTGRDIVVSAAVRADPEVSELLAAGELAVEPLDATLKGFDERFALWRVASRG